MKRDRFWMLMLSFCFVGSVIPASAGWGEEPMGLLHVQGNVYLLHGAGPNITVQVGDQAVVLVNAGPADMSEQIRAVIRTLSPKPIGFILDTSADLENTGGNENLARGGFFMLSSANQMRQQASVVAYEKVLDRMTAEKRPMGEWPTDTYDSPKWDLYANGEPLILEHAAAAHSDADTVVFFRGSDVVSTGDIVDMTGYPVIDAKHGGSLSGILKELNHLLQDVAIAKENEEGGTYFVPSHGPITDRNDVANYRDMLTIIQGRIRDDVNKHLTLAQVIALKPTYDYDGEYGRKSGSWTTDMFIESVYRELNVPESKPEAAK